MKISKLINKLEKVKQIQGDVDIIILTKKDEDTYEIWPDLTFANLYSNDNYIFVELVRSDESPYIFSSIDS